MTAPALDALCVTPATSAANGHSTLPLFRFGAGADGGLLAIIAGGLILDLGEAERTFVFRCQDRFLCYSGLWRLPSIFFVASERHVDIYRDHIAVQRARYELIRARTALFASRPLYEPIYVGCDIDEMRVFPCEGLARQLRDITPKVAVGLNQISPTYAALLVQLASLLRRHGLDCDATVEDCAVMGGLAKRCADKADYLALTTEDSDLPPHVPTVVLSAAALCGIGDYDQLATVFRQRTGSEANPGARFFIKATLNSSGNLAALVGPENFSAELVRLRKTLLREAAVDGPEMELQVAELRQEVDDAPCLRSLGFSDGRLRAYKIDQARHRQRLDFLLQPEICPRGDDPAFSSIGLSYVIARDGTTVPLGANAQIYRDHAHKHFQGAFLSDAIGQALPPAFHGQMHALCSRYAARGYHGPISFDARRDAEARYRLIYDCNPRLTGVFPSLAVRDALRGSGVPVVSLLTLGYRGEFIVTDLATALDRLETAGLLCTRHNQRGVILLPNLCRDDGFDVHLVNIDLDEANGLLAGPLATLSASGGHPACLYG